ncbi:hypothetical protein K438DRAFT_1909851 [Mycena galopus ATCC 62051]|nr:hypothetical protein K438DRAFT_1909851 [Mycena galopus ATCC 62051]
MAHPRSLPPPPQTQARCSSTFRPPPLDGSLTMAQIYDWHFENTPDHRLFVYAQADGTKRIIYWPEAVHAVYVGAKILRDRLKWTPGVVETPVVAILASSDTIPYFTLIMSCMRANYIVFPISPRNSPSAVAHLVDKVGVKHILVGQEPAMMDLATTALNILKSDYPQRKSPDLSRVPLFEDIFLPESDRTMKPDTLPYEYKGPDATACIMHSSGSTAFPKPIYWSNHRTIEAALIPWFGGRDLTNQVLSLHSMPMYHGMGILQTMWSASSGLVLSGFEPKAIPTIPTPGNLFQAAKATDSDIIFCVPAFIEAWSREPEYIEWLATRAGVLYGGGPLNKQAGDYMTSQGVSIFILYGSSEGGIMSPFFQLVVPEMVPNGDNTFELIMVSNIFCKPAVLNTKVRGIESYATSDLLMPHPTKPGHWKFLGGRMIKLCTIQARRYALDFFCSPPNTNPGPLENLLNQDPHVLTSVMFGRGRFQAGVIVDPKPEFKFDPADSVKLAEFRNKIWPTVEKMNDFAPQHSRLFKEMILVAKPNKPFTYTAKMTARRQAVIADYEDEIGVLYDTVEDTASLNIPALVNWDADAILLFCCNHRLGDDDDMFHHGCDSLQATWIRNALLRTLRESAQLDTRQDTRNFVYDHPTIRRRCCRETKSSAMHAMVAKYVEYLPTHAGQQAVPPTTEMVVLVTGTIGELGCYILALYALNRPARESLRERQTLALVDRGLNRDIMQKCITHIIHSAWPVDFNLALRSFEPNLLGLRKLVDFSLGSPFTHPPTLIYTSSIGVFQHITGGEPFPEAAIESGIAAGTGYSESKWISEEILRKAGESTPLKSVVVRVGQLCGGVNGAWNAQEWVPALVQSGKAIGCIPDDSRPIAWRTLGAVVSAELNVPLVPYADWLSRLEDAAKAQGHAAPLRAARLLEFFKSVNHKNGDDEEAFGFTKLDMTRALASSPSLRDTHRLGEKDVKQWIKYWRSVSLL